MPAWLLDLFARYGYAVVFVGVFLENTGLPVPGRDDAAGRRGARAFRSAVARPGDRDRDRRRDPRRQPGFLHRPPRRPRGSPSGTAGASASRPTGSASSIGSSSATGRRRCSSPASSPACGSSARLLAGGSGMKWPQFLFYNATGAIVWCTAVAAAGYSLAYSWDDARALDRPQRPGGARAGRRGWYHRVDARAAGRSHHDHTGLRTFVSRSALSRTSAA